MNWLLNSVKNHGSVQTLLNKEERFAHVSLIQEALLLLGVQAQAKQPYIIVKSNEQEARALYEQIKELDAESQVTLFTQEESLRVEAIAPSVVMQESKATALYQLVYGMTHICITHVDALTRKMMSKQTYKAHAISLRNEAEITMEELQKKLIRAGYHRTDRVEAPMTFAARGGVVDVFSVQYDQPIRIEFFDTVIESIRLFDTATQRTTTIIEEVLIVPVSDMLLNEEDIMAIEIKTSQGLDKRKAQLGEKTFHELSDNLREDLDNLKTHYYDVTLYPYLSFLDDCASILDYFIQPVLVYSNSEDVSFVHRQHMQDTIEYIQEKVSEHRFLPNFLTFFSLEKFKDVETVHFYKYQVENEFVIPWHTLPAFKNDLRQFCHEIEKQAFHEKVVLTLNTANIKEISELLIQMNIPYQMLIDEPQVPGIYLEHGELSQGFVLEDLHICRYSAKEIMGQTQKRTRYTNKFKEAETLNALSDLVVGDYIVHQQYGIGQYLGIITKEIDAVHKDFLHIAYRNDDVLLVPLEQFSLVRKYVSREAVSIKLSKLGSKEWEKTKARIKSSVSDIADRLIAIYALRKEAQGYSFSKDNELHEAFDEEFEYELTPDQEQAIREVKADMEAPLPMDRLLCGDVGFGKTEVAIRAAFKAAADHKQVIYLCPTTILSSQHYNTFTDRFKNFPVKVALLNRFVSVAKQKEIIRAFKEGSVDIIIGTHRVLSKDIISHNLGLLIIDEEQRFGVEHKERIKEMKVNIDVLSLSATPIPRTLQMSLIGLRSLSQLNTPPSNRLPVMTYVVEKNQQLIDDIITKELNRKGQVFYLYNNIDRIHEVAYRIQQNVKDAKVAVIHGKMDRDDIEEVMIQFHDNDINVLICTTIIETGIDIPNANTMLIDNAQNFGLSQLYQIKGRVGRSDRLAYTYLLVPEKKQLSEIASKRLQAIKEFSQLGSGYKIAMRDLTIRGAGELLGGSQSGFIDTVGIDMYIELLQEVIQEKQGKVTEERKQKKRLTLPIDGYIPDSFTDLDKQKIELYQQIDKINSFRELKSFYDEISDVFGVLPNEVNLLLEKKRLELSLNDDHIESLKERDSRVDLVFTEAYSSQIDGVALFEMINALSRDIQIKYQQQKIKLQIPKDDQWLSYVLEILNKVSIRKGVS